MSRPRTPPSASSAAATRPSPWTTSSSATRRTWWGRRSRSLRVDDHAEPVAELQRLYDKSLERYQPFIACLAGRHDPVGLTDRTQIEQRVARFHAARVG
jgi:uncharacterized Ntn-hydrolase superfamily protein